MIHARILELVKSPYSIQQEDLALLQSEIVSKPYMQSIRVLYLYGVNKFSSQDYSKKLSETAAYTTDKKILYHFINQNESVISNISEQEELEIVDNQLDINPTEIEEEIIEVESAEGISEIEDIQENEPIIEENIISEDIKETEIVSEDIENKESIQSVDIQEDVESSSELNFHRTEDFFLPQNTTIPQVKKVENYKPKPVTNNKREEEMKRLIAEVEAKIKAKKAQEQQQISVVEEPTIEDSEISFYNTQSFEIQSDNNKEEERIIEEIEPETINSNWKPMQVSQSLPDALIGEKKEEKLISEKLETKEEVNIAEENKNLAKTEDSNIPQFINTWQSWLKINRVEILEEIEKEIEEEQTAEKPVSMEEIKEKAIEKFIETEPKITKISKEETPQPFVYKEKDDDIWHLMTETLANLYLEQRLYAKAVKAYEVLQEKYPEKHADFELKIEEIKQQK